MNNIEELILDHYGTKAQFAREMGITYVTALKWIKNPGTIKMSVIDKISLQTGKDICLIINNSKNGIYIDKSLLNDESNDGGPLS